MLRTLVILVWLSSFISIFATPYKGLFVVVTAVATVALFFFPIKYANRETVCETAQKDLSFLGSPLPYLIVAFLAIIGFLLCGH
ncbi:hypothetical protein SAMN05660691_02275 [Rheinheimera pacifica]|uniref:Uncharacterized protein n=1 Tax=Rheinheimera pacifica TaxID=173990 RepID=A0A1H6M586_9GAMM|nr:hypothetical protein [Rheinheimera pacifica]SEH94061.1 hypothetical protein SAMN05660691_02275 [Rheinheimera pacifica]